MIDLHKFEYELTIFKLCGFSPYYSIEVFHNASWKKYLEYELS